MTDRRSKSYVGLTIPRLFLPSKFWLAYVMTLVLVSVLCMIAASPAAWSYQCAWEQLYRFTPISMDDRLGHSVSGGADVNNDGYHDLIVGAPFAGGDHSGRVYVYSGLTGERIRLWPAWGTDDRFGYSISGAGDVNNDGYDDVIVGAPYNDAGGTNAGRAYVHSGQTGSLLWTFTGEGSDDQFGRSVSGTGDVNNDGYDDLIVGTRYNDAGGTNAGRAYVYSGQTGGLIWTFTGEVAGDGLGRSVSGAGDVNNDGYADLIVGAAFYDGGGTDVGRAYVYSGQTGGLLWTFDGEATYDRFGSSVSGAGDVNDDGYADLIVGAYSNDAGGTSAGRAYVYSGQTGGLLWTFTGEAADNEFGRSVSWAGDTNGDGYDDLIVGAWQVNYGGDNVGRAYVYCGESGVKLHTFTGQATGDYFGVSVSGAGDVNNDGIDDLIVGAYLSNIDYPNGGRAYVFSGRTDVLCFTGEAEGDQLGSSVSGIGDFNDDGYDDVIVGAPENDVGGTDAGQAYVFSGQSGANLCTFTGDAPTEALGWSVSGAGDIDNDGYDDVVIGAPYSDPYNTDGGEAKIYSGPDCWCIATYYLAGEASDHVGYSVSGAGDINNDGYDEIIIGEPGVDDAATNAGRVACCAGHTTTIFWTETGEAAGDLFGHSVSGAGDVNNDGYDDWIVGAPYNNAAGYDAGRAYVYSGQTGGLLWTFTGEAAGNYFGYSVSGAGDVNDDGYDDLIVGASENDAGGASAGRAYVYSGQSGDLLYTFSGQAPHNWFGWSVSGAGDVNNDGYDDLIVGAPWNSAGGSGAGRVYVFCGRTGALLCTFDGEAAGDFLGHSVSGAGDVDNDGYDEVIVGAFLNDAGGEGAGRAYVFGCEAFATSICGDANADEIINVGDIVYLVSYLYKAGPAPVPACAGDVNSDDIVNIGDVVYLVSYLYKGGNSPAPYCCLELIEGCQGLEGR